MEYRRFIRFADGPTGSRAALIGSGLDVWEVISTVLANDGDLTETAAFLAISPELVEAAVSYYGDHGDEIDAEITLNQAEWERGYAAWKAAGSAACISLS